jgi:hypothetical protein
MSRTHGAKLPQTAGSTPEPRKAGPKIKCKHEFVFPTRRLIEVQNSVQLKDPSPLVSITW